jgi:hypothetical protein
LRSASTAAARDGFALHRFDGVRCFLCSTLGCSVRLTAVRVLSVGVFAFPNMLVSVLVFMRSSVSIMRYGGPGLDIRRLHRCGRRITGSKGMSALLFHLLDLIDNRGDDVVEFFAFFFEKIADVQEGVAIESDFDEGRLHAWQHACHTTFVNASD